MFSVGAESVVYFLLILIAPFCRPSNVEKHNEPPSLFNLEDYDECLSRKGKFPIYCLVDAQIEPNISSELWNQIMEVSNKKSNRHYDHDRLYYGVCMERCKKDTFLYDILMIKHHYLGNLNDSAIIDYNIKVYKRSSDKRFLFNKLVNYCLNGPFKAKYKLLLHSSIEYCMEEKTKLGYTFLDILCICLIISIIIMVVCSSFADYRFKNKYALGENHYKEKLTLKGQSLLVSFSLFRNWESLTKVNKNSFQFFEPLRFVIFSGILFGHVFLMASSIQIANPEYVENIMDSILGKFITNGRIIIQMFFVISGFLLYNKIQNIFLDYPDRNIVVILVDTIIRRYLRSIFSILFIILFNATILHRLGDGPLWRHYTENDLVFCRDEWWKNVLFVNNVFFEDSCLQHTWYLATDFQLYVIFATIIVILVKVPKLKKIAIYLIMVVSFLIPTIIIYKYNIEGLYQETPRTFRYKEWTSETLLRISFPWYSNMAGYLMGTFVAVIRQNLMDTNPNIYSNKKFKIVWHLMFPISILVILLYSPNMGYFDLIYAWLAGALNPIIGLIYGIFVLGISFKGLHGKCPTFFIILGRLTFQAFLCHPIVMYSLLGTLRNTVHMNFSFLLTYFVATLTLTYMLAAYLMLTVEKPIYELFGVFLNKPVKERTIISTTTENNEL